MSNEKKLILEMLNKGEISVIDAEKLLDEIEGGEKGPQDQSSPEKPDYKKFLRIRVTEDNNQTVNINFPIALAEVGLKLVPQDKLKIEGTEISINDILKLIEEGAEGELVNIDTVDDGKEVKVKVFID